MSFDPALPKPYKENWREAYRYNDADTPRLSTYQAPEEEPVPFVFDANRLSGGQSVDTAEYPFFGFWSNTPLNEKPHAITVNGFIRGDTYIKNRNAIIEALRAKTDDDNPGFIDLPLWGRFPVVVVSWDVEEKGRENGQCSISITLSRAGVTTEERWKFEDGGFDFYRKTEAEAEKLKDAAINSFDKALAGNMDTAALASGFTRLKTGLLGVTGRIQGAVSTLNKITGAVTGISSLIAQGVRAPRDLAQALFSAASGIIAGAMEIKNSVIDTYNYFGNLDNMGNMLVQFFSASGYRLDTEAVTVKQMATKTATENLYRTMSLCAAAQILVQLENPTYQRVKSYWSLYEKLEAVVDQSDPAVYQAVQNMRIAAAKELAARSLDAELIRYISTPAPLLYLAHHLGCDNEKLRALNRPADSFVMRGDIKYV
jgi:prophage DNA circulation protein